MPSTVAQLEWGPVTVILHAIAFVSFPNRLLGSAEPIRFDRAVAEAVVRGDFTAAERIDAQNRYEEQHCG